jgi:hypothetical protein
MSEDYKLTDSDRADIEASLGKDADDYTRRSARIEASFGVGEFVDGRWRHVSPYVDWTVRTLFDMSETQFDYSRLGPFSSIEELRNAFEQDVKAQWDEHLERLEDDPEYREYRTRCGDEIFRHHPWGNDCIDNCRRWLAETPYQVWKIAHDVEEWAAQLARDAVADWCTDGFQGDNKDMIRSTQDRYEEHIKRIQKGYDEARVREAAERETAKQARVEREWDLAPLA